MSSSDNKEFLKLGRDAYDHAVTLKHNGGYDSSKKQSYRDYIETDKLLSLQYSSLNKGLFHHDEHLFIVIHQNFEIWFTQVLWELQSVRNILQLKEKVQHKNPVLVNGLSQRDARVACKRLARCDRIIRLATQNFDILETMDPSDFLEFRDYIGPGSGFQSRQMRELEIIIGLKAHERVKCGGNDFRIAFKPDECNRLEFLMKSDSLLTCVQNWLAGIKVPAKFQDVFMKAKLNNLREQKKLWNMESSKVDAMIKKETDRLEPYFAGGDEFGENETNLSDDEKKIIGKRRLAALFVLSYRQHPKFTPYADLLDLAIGCEQAVMLWRSRHLRMVDRMIGTRVGTGGSSGTGYLMKTVKKYRVFKDLWYMRTIFVKNSSLPSLDELQAM